MMAKDRLREKVRTVDLKHHPNLEIILLRVVSVIVIILSAITIATFSYVTTNKELIGKNLEERKNDHVRLDSEIEEVKSEIINLQIQMLMCPWSLLK